MKGAPLKRRVRSRFRRLLRGTYILLLLCVVTVFGFAKWGRLLEVSAERWLESMLGGCVRIERIELSLTRGCSVNGLTICSDAEGEKDPYLILEEANLLFKTFPGSELIAVSAEGLEITVTENENGLEPRWIFAERPASDRHTRLEIRSGRFRFVGQGPVHDQICSYLQDPSALQVDVRRLEVIPRNEGQTFELRGSLRPPVGPLTHFEGEGRHRLDWIRFRIDREEPLDLSDDAVRTRLAGPIREWLDRNGVHGQVVYTGNLVGLEDLSAFEDLLSHLEVDIELMQLAICPEDFPCPLEKLRGRLKLQGRNMVLSGLDGEHEGARALIDGVINDLPGRQDMELTLRVNSVSLTRELQEALALTVGRDFLDAFRPRGRFDITAKVKLTFDEEGRPQTSVSNDIEMKDVEMCYHGFAEEAGGRRDGFPLPLRNVRGTITAENEQLEWKNVVARTESGAVVRTRGRLEWGADSPTGKVTVSVLDLPLDEAFLSACSAALGAEADEFARVLGLGGNADLRMELELQDGDLGDGLIIELVPRDVRVRHQSFPLPVRFNEGRVRYQGGRILVQGASGRIEQARERPGGAVEPSPVEPGRVRVEGWFDPETNDLSLHFRGREVQLSDDFRLACAAISDQGTESVFQDMCPQGAVDLAVDWDSVESHQLDEVLIRVEPLSTRLDPPALGVPIDHLVGSAQIRSRTSGEWVITVPMQGGLEGRILEGRIGFSGEVKTDEQTEGYLGQISISAERVRIRGAEGEQGPHLFTALDQTSPELADILRELSPSGWLRMHSQLEWGEGEWSLAHVDFGPDLPSDLDTAGLRDREGIHLFLPLLDRTLVWKGGTVRGEISTGKWGFPQLDAVLEDSQLTLKEGNAVWSDEGIRITFRGKLGSLAVDELIAPFFPEGGPGRWRTTGTTHTDLTDVVIEIPRDRPTARSLTARAVVDLSKCGLKSATGSHTLDGSLVVQLDYRDEISENPGMHIFGTLDGATLSVAGTEVQNLSAEIDLRDDQLTISALRGEYAGGRLTVGDKMPFVIPLEGDSRYIGHLTLDSADISRLLGDDNPITKDLEGRVRLEVTIQGLGADPRRFAAIGLIEVENGQLWSIPVFDRLYSYGISPLLGQTEPPRFEEGTVHFRFQDGIFFVTDLHMKGPSLSVDGRGALGPERMHMHLQPVVELPFHFPIVGKLLQGVFSITQRKTLSFRFEGPYSDPSSRYDLLAPDSIEEFAKDLDQPRLSHPPKPVFPKRF